MTRLINHHCDAVTAEPPIEAGVLIDFTVAVRECAIITPPRRTPPARLDRSPDALMWFSLAEAPAA